VKSNPLLDGLALVPFVLAAAALIIWPLRFLAVLAVVVAAGVAVLLLIRRRNRREVARERAAALEQAGRRAPTVDELARAEKIAEHRRLRRLRQARPLDDQGAGDPTVDTLAVDMFMRHPDLQDDR
jgi:biopolymer transport protein ExbB/TolQ